MVLSAELADVEASVALAEWVGVAALVASAEWVGVAASVLSSPAVSLEAGVCLPRLQSGAPVPSGVGPLLAAWGGVSPGCGWSGSTHWDVALFLAWCRDLALPRP